MLELIIFYLALLCTNPTHIRGVNCPGYHMTTSDSDPGGETGDVPPTPPTPPPPPPPRP